MFGYTIHAAIVTVQIWSAFATTWDHVDNHAYVAAEDLVWVCDFTTAHVYFNAHAQRYDQRPHEAWGLPC